MTGSRAGHSGRLRSSSIVHRPPRHHSAELQPPGCPHDSTQKLSPSAHGCPARGIGSQRPSPEFRVVVFTFAPPVGPSAAAPSGSLATSAAPFATGSGAAAPRTGATSCPAHAATTATTNHTRARTRRSYTT